MESERIQKLVQENISKLTAALESGCSDTLKAFLRAMAQFRTYSLHNVMLIAAQCPEATKVAGFHAWRRLGRYVKKGEKGIRILAPMVLRRPAEEGKDQENDEIVRFKTVCVFDVSQTDGEPLPTISEATGDPAEYTDRLKEMVRDRGISLQYSDKLGSAYGASSGGMITIKEGLSPAEEFSVLIHELAHEMLHHNSNKESKVVRETEAEAVAFVVCEAVGLDANNAANDYIQLYEGDKATLMGSLQQIRDTSMEIIAGITGETDGQGESARGAVGAPVPMAA